MKVLLLGVGMQGKAALHDLVNSEGVTKIIAADRDFGGLEAYLASKDYGEKVICEYVDTSETESIARLMQQDVDVAIDLASKDFGGIVASVAVEQGVHLVNTSYATPEINALMTKAQERGVSILPEFGMDPGIDLVLLGEAVRAFDTVKEVITYGAGFPEAVAAQNPIKYKVTWTFDGVLSSYRRAGRIIRDGEILELDDAKMFDPEYIHEIDIEGLGKLEAFPNGDAIKYANLLDLDTASLLNLGRYVLRWPGHCAFWKTLVDLRFLDDEPILVDGTSVDRKKFLSTLLEPQLQYAQNERDVVVVRIDVSGIKDGKPKRVVYQGIDYRDLETGFMSMNRTVGYSASIGAQMIGRGIITKRGVLSPVHDIPYEVFVDELGKREIHISCEVS